jgi:2'-hydroxyisoflavone reductase
VRPGLIVGPHDPTDRFTYWPVRVARGGAVLAPGRPARGVQFIDVRDLAEWMVRSLEGDIGGTFNATGPGRPLAMVELLEACKRASGSDARFTWADDARLLEEGIAPWREMPLWIPESDGAMHGLMSASIARALAKGLVFRRLEDTIGDTLAWARTRATGHAWKAGLSAEREAALLR